jgi:hypothetical protein
MYTWPVEDTGGAQEVHLCVSTELRATTQDAQGNDVSIDGVLEFREGELAGQPTLRILFRDETVFTLSAFKIEIDPPVDGLTISYTGYFDDGKNPEQTINPGADGWCRHVEEGFTAISVQLSGAAAANWDIRYLARLGATPSNERALGATLNKIGTASAVGLEYVVIDTITVANGTKCGLGGTIWGPIDLPDDALATFLRNRAARITHFSLRVEPAGCETDLGGPILFEKTLTPEAARTMFLKLQPNVQPVPVANATTPPARPVAPARPSRTTRPRRGGGGR